MAHPRAPQDLSPQDSTFLFISTLQEQLAKSDFVTNINNNKPSESQSARGPGPSTPSKPSKESGRTAVVVSASSSSSSSSSSTAMKPIVPKWSEKDSQGARITRLKPPRQAK